MTLQHYLPVCIFFSVTLFACKKNPEKQISNEKIQKLESKQTAGVLKDDDYASKWMNLDNLLGQKEYLLRPLNEEGHIVQLKYAYDCILQFNPAMHEHGFIADTTIPVIPTGPVSSKCFSAFRLITEFEEFGGENLLFWMNSIASRYPAMGKNSGWAIRLYFGIYTDAFLDKYVQDKDLRIKMRGRITVFLVPYIYDQFRTGIVNWGDPEDTAYELGGLYP